MESNEMGGAQPNDAVSGGQGGESVQAGSAVEQEQQQVTSRGESRLLGEVKSLKQQISDMKAYNEQLEMQKLEVEGNKDKMIEHLQNKVQSLESSNKQKESAFATATLGSQVKTEAAKMGCANPDDLVKLIDLQSIPVDPETYTGDTDSIRLMLEQEKKSRPFFFGKPAPQVQDVVQQNAVLNRPQKDYSQMSREELDEEIKRVYKEKI